MKCKLRRLHIIVYVFLKNIGTVYYVKSRLGSFFDDDVQK